jgi:hypothetical protein
VFPAPTLELHYGSGAAIASNDNWKDTQQAEIGATGTPPNDDRESAVVATLAPGKLHCNRAWRKQHHRRALVEVYNIQ